MRLQESHTPPPPKPFVGPRLPTGLARPKGSTTHVTVDHSRGARPQALIEVFGPAFKVKTGRDLSKERFVLSALQSAKVGTHKDHAAVLAGKMKDSFPLPDPGIGGLSAFTPASISGTPKAERPTRMNTLPGGDRAGKDHGQSLFDKAAGGVSHAVGGYYSDLLGSPNARRVGDTMKNQGLTAALGEISDQTTHQAASALHVSPKIPIPTDGSLDPATEAMAKGANPSKAERDKISKERGLPPGRFMSDTDRRGAFKIARANGWSDLSPNVTDFELAAKMFTPHGTGWKGIALDAGNDLAKLSALPSGIAGMATAVASGHGGSVLQGMKDDFVKRAKNPGHFLLHEPFSTLSYAVPVAKGAGAVAGRVPILRAGAGGLRFQQLGNALGAGRERSFTHTPVDASAEGTIARRVPLSPQSKNIATAAVQKVADAALHSDRVAQRVIMGGRVGGVEIPGVVTRGVRLEIDRGAHRGKVASSTVKASVAKAVMGGHIFSKYRLSAVQREAATRLAAQGFSADLIVAALKRDLADLERGAANGHVANHEIAGKREAIKAYTTLAKAERTVPAVVIRGLRDTMHPIEAANSEKMVKEGGFSASALHDRLYDPAIDFHPDLPATIEKYRTVASEGRSTGSADRATANREASDAEIRANRLEKHAAKLKTEKGKAPHLEAAQLLRERASNLRGQAHATQNEAAALDAVALARAEIKHRIMTESEHQPAIYVPEVARENSKFALRNSANPFVNPWGSRALENTGFNRRAGLNSNDPFIAINAAGRPSEIVAMKASISSVLAKYGVEVTGKRVTLPKNQVAIEVNGAGLLKPNMLLRRGEEAVKDMRGLGADKAGIDEALKTDYNFVHEGEPLDPSKRYVVVDRAVYDSILDQIHRHSQMHQSGPIANATQAWRTITVNTLMRSVVNNGLGTAVLAGVSGASPRDFMRAALDPEMKGIIKSQIDLANSGQTAMTTQQFRAGSMMRALAHKAAPGNKTVERIADASSPARWLNGIRFLNRTVEGYGRAVSAIHVLERDASKELRGELGGLRGSMESLTNTIKGGGKTAPIIRKNLSDPAYVEKFLREVEDFQGHLGRVSQLDARFYAVSTFWSWYQHVAKLTLVTLPFKYPGRNLILNSIAEQGQEYLRRNGIFQPWLAGAIALRRLDGIVDFTSTSGWDPFSTMQGLAPVNIGGTGLDLKRPIMGLLSPAVGAPTTALLAPKPGGTWDTVKSQIPFYSIYNAYNGGNPNSSVKHPSGLWGAANVAWGAGVGSTATGGPQGELSFAKEITRDRGAFDRLTPSQRIAWANAIQKSDDSHPLNRWHLDRGGRWVRNGG